MKKSFLVLASFAAIAVGCQVEKMDELPFVDNSVVYTASTEAYAPSTKTAMDELDVVWSENDKIAVFQGYLIQDEFQVTAASVGKTTGEFTLVAESDKEFYDELDFNVAYYPYSEDMMYLDWGDGVVRLSTYFPNVQEYKEGTFADDVFPMIAVTETTEDKSFAFKNVLGVLKLQLKGTKTVKSITVEGNSFETLAGSFMVMQDGETPTVQQGDYPLFTSVTLDCGEGVKLNASNPTAFHIALPPTEFSTGFSVTLVDSENNVYKFATAVENTVSRSTILAMPTVDVDLLTPPVDFEATSSLLDVNLEFTVNDEEVTGFYGIFAAQDMWSSVASMFVDPDSFASLLAGGYVYDGLPCFLYEGREYVGSLSEFGLSDDLISEEGISNYVVPGTGYNVIIVPVLEGKTEYSISDALIYEVSTAPMTTDGEIVLPSYTIDKDLLSLSVNFEASNDIVYAIYKFYTADSELPTEENCFDELYGEAEFNEDGSFVVSHNASYGENPGTDYKLCILLVGADGKGELHVLDASTKPIPYDENLTFTVEADFDSDANQIYATVTSWPENADIFYAINSSSGYNDYSAATNFVQVLKEQYYYFKKVDMTGVEDSFEVTLDFNPTKYESKRYVHLFAITESGSFSHINTTAVTIPAASAQ